MNWIALTRESELGKFFPSLFADVLILWSHCLIILLITCPWWSVTNFSHKIMLRSTILQMSLEASRSSFSCCRCLRGGTLVHEDMTDAPLSPQGTTYRTWEVLFDSLTFFDPMALEEPWSNNKVRMWKQARKTARSRTQWGQVWKGGSPWKRRKLFPAKLWYSVRWNSRAQLEVVTIHNWLLCARAHSLWPLFTPYGSLGKEILPHAFPL